MKSKKMLFVLLLTFVMVFAFAACGGSGGSGGESSLAGNTYVLTSCEIAGEDIPELNGARSFTFKEDGTYELAIIKTEFTEESTHTGTYSENGSAVHLTPDVAEDGEADFTIDGDTLIDEGSEEDEEGGGTFTWKYVYTKTE